LCLRLNLTASRLLNSVRRNCLPSRRKALEPEHGGNHVLTLRNGGMLGAVTALRVPAFSARWLWRRPRSEAQLGRKGLVSHTIESICISLLATLTCLLLCEMAVRIAVHAPLPEWRDFRHERAAKTVNQLVQHDSVFGWRLKSFIHLKGFNTLQYGFRSNGSPDAEVHPGGVLAVGSSFTAGSEVADEETWPAHLQQLTGWNVNNAGQGNYVADQIIMIGEQLLPLIHPRVLVVDLIPDNIVGASYSSYGWPKPYFTVEHGQLVQHNSPVPHLPDPGRDHFGIKPFLGHFAAVDRFMVAFFVNSWFSSDGTSYSTVSNDVVDVTCRLLSRLKQTTDATNVRLILYLQFGGASVMSSPQEAIQAVRVGECARNMNVPTVDEFAKLREIYEKSPDELRKYYVIEADGAVGHKSSLGNLEVAKNLEAAIAELGVMPQIQSQNMQ
jgi:hypothetical protein